jgi:16S rRNA (uracil1498-N3)-methyltransferase
MLGYLQIGRRQGNLHKINILIGPEGGFTNNEVEDLISFGFEPVCLGSEVLRVETAALYAIASVKTLLLELNYQEDKG